MHKKHLNDDECEILAGIIYGLNYDEILTKTHLSHQANSYKSITNIIEKLPQKFHVQNMTQVIFRIILVKPLIWHYSSISKIVKSIKDINHRFNFKIKV